MVIERINNEIVIKISSDTDITGLQRLIDYIKFREIASKSKASEDEINNLVRESKSEWWEKNKNRFIK
ncbi:MAG: hypothetical protein WC121_08230 [Candidatus Kapaibacterium sp.]|jgi:hypothetical protein